MADDINVTPGSGAIVRAYEIGGKKHQAIASPGDYETVGASVSTPQTIGGTGAAGDYLVGLLVVPGTTSPGAVQIKDGSNSAITVFEGGAASVGDLRPFFIYLGLRSIVGAWQVTTGANVSVIAVGAFTS